MPWFRSSPHSQIADVDTRTQKLVARLEVATAMVEEAADHTNDTVMRFNKALDRLEAFLAEERVPDQQGEPSNNV